MKRNVSRVVTLRLSKELYNQLVDIADEEERSLNQQVCWIIKQYIQSK